MSKRQVEVPGTYDSRTEKDVRRLEVITPRWGRHHLLLVAPRSPVTPDSEVILPGGTFLGPKRTTTVRRLRLWAVENGGRVEVVAA